MKTLADFTKTTLIGGLLIILPIYVAVLLLAKATSGLLRLLDPLASRIPAAEQFRAIVAILLLVAIWFIVGVVVRTGPGLRAKNALEQAVFDKMPGYTFLRGLAKRLTGKSEEQTLQPALVEIEEALVPALIVEELEDGCTQSLSPRRRRQWQEVSTSCRPSGFIRSIYLLPKPSACSRNGVSGRASSCAQ